MSGKLPVNRKLMQSSSAEKLLVTQPLKLANFFGFTDMNATHEDWIQKMIHEFYFALQAHRNSYKTSSVVIACLSIVFLYPSASVLILRKSVTQAIELLRQIRIVMESDKFRYLFYTIFGQRRLEGKTWTDSTLTHAARRAYHKKEPSFKAGGIDTFKTGDHYDFIFADDIITDADRYSKAVRLRTFHVLQELPNLLVNTFNRRGKLRFSGTPWHMEDAWQYIRNVQKFPYGKTGVSLNIDELRESMSKELFALNYKLEALKDDDEFIFANPQWLTPELMQNFIFLIDPAYGGKSLTACAGVKREGQKVFVIGKTWTKSIAAIDEAVINFMRPFKPMIAYIETNADHGLSLKNIRGKCSDIDFMGYSESKGKDERIQRGLMKFWNRIFFVPDFCPPEFMSHITDYTYGARPCDAADALAGALSKLPESPEDRLPHERKVSFGGYELS